jgi:O-acetyl-ADP-ribose deacetylase (regulator of RNase III)
MTDNKKQTMQFLFADRELIIKVADLLAAPVDVIVNPANVGLSHGGGVAGQIAQQGGDIIQEESDIFIKEHGMLESGMVAFTTAGHLSYDAIIHAVGPKMGEGDEQRKIQLAVSRSLQLCDMHDWKSIAFPAISSGIFGVPIEISAQAFFHAITSYWDARMDTAPEKVVICLTENNFQPFLHAFREESFVRNGGKDDVENNKMDEAMKKNNVDAEPEAGIVDLSEEDISSLDNDEVNDWFK